MRPTPPPPAMAIASSASPASSFLPPKDAAREVHKKINNLNLEDENAIMKAAASLAMLATLPEVEPHLFPSVPRLVSILNGGYSVHVQRNACAALTAMMNASFMLYMSVAETPNLIAGLLKCLKSNTNDAGLQLNASAALSVLAQQDQGLALVREAEVEDVILSLLGSNVEVALEEELMDSICALAAHEQMRPALLQKGAVSKLALHLGTDSPEVCVRVLLALGMLCGSSADGQCELAKADGAVKSLLSLMKSNDLDIKTISHDLFGSLASNQQTRLLVEQGMRSS